MLVVKRISELRSLLDEVKESGRTIGFVPTMGALHQGHISLVNRAAKESDFVVMSIFVNPTQFNDKGDLVRYPRDLNKDLTMLEETACEMVFIPDVDEIYPEPDTRRFQFGIIETVMEGEHRPGHFNGVAQVVSKLFDIVRPDKAFFGLKDFQQLVVIKSLVKQLTLPVEIVPCDIIREDDGLAMSSRNTLLSKEQRANAILISKTLFEARNKAKDLSVEELSKWVIKRINENDFLEVEYFDIVDDEQLQSVKDWSDPVTKVGCIAVHCDKIRLIDNIIFNR